MAIYLKKSNSLILRIPKTGTRWVKTAIERSGVKFTEVGPPELRGHGTLANYKQNYAAIACFVRHPFTWYRSYWGYRTKNGWRPKYTLDRLCQSTGFQDFVRKACVLLPGIATQIFASYIGPSNERIHFVGKQEHLTDDLIRFLLLVGEDFDEELLRLTPKVNATTFSSSDIPDETKELITFSEFEGMEQFGYTDNGWAFMTMKEINQNYSQDFIPFRNLAIWTQSIHWKFDDAKALAGQPRQVKTRLTRTLANFALFMELVRNNYEAAEHFYIEAVKSDPSHPRTLGNYALFLEKIRKNYELAYQFYLKAISVRPNHPHNLGNFALFLETIKKDYSRAEIYYLRAIKANPDHQFNRDNFRRFRANRRKEYLSVTEDLNV